MTFLTFPLYLYSIGGWCIIPLCSQTSAQKIVGPYHFLVRFRTTPNAYKSMLGLIIAYLLVSWYLVLIGIGLLGWREACVISHTGRILGIDECFWVTMDLRITAGNVMPLELIPMFLFRTPKLWKESPFCVPLEASIPICMKT
jgi:hypothetical protein